MSIRKPVVSGKFYPDDKQRLIETIEYAIEKEKSNIDYSLSENEIIGGIVPHAGYMFSSFQAIHFFEIIKNKDIDTVIIINPSHTGIGNEISIDDHDYWETPLGKIEVDTDLANEMIFPKSNIEQSREHSGEVMVPFLQYYFNDSIKIFPLTIKFQSYKNSIRVANEIFSVNQKLNRKIIVIASSDFSHLVPPKYGMEIDHLAVDNILNFDSEGFNEIIMDKNISICGFGPIMTLIQYAKSVKKHPVAKILKFGSSGDVIPSNEVVDYFSILIYS